ncbi:Sialidase [Xylariales sp. PMI_506]|nr:Sialidase [Xylariales sp. PMI_506]
MHGNSIIRAAWLSLAVLPSLALGLTIPTSQKHATVERAISKDIVASPSTSNAYPRAVVLSDDSILMSYTHSDGAARTLTVLRSTDSGASFSPYGSIASRDSDADLDNAFLMEIPGSSPPHVMAAFRNHDLNSAGNYTYYRITVCDSPDGGKTWDFLSQAYEYAPPAGVQLGIWEPFLRMSADGSKVQLYYSGELATNNQQIFLTESSNSGSSWSTPVDLLLHSNSDPKRDGMAGIASLTDTATKQDALVMIFETGQNGLFTVNYAVSYNDGASWGDRSPAYRPSASGHNAGSPQIAAYTSGGKTGLTALFMTDEDYPSSQVNWPTAAEVKTIVAPAGLSGGAVVWDNSTDTTLGPDDSHWPGLLEINGKDVAMFDTEGVIKALLVSN